MNGKKTMKAWQMIVAVVLLAAMMITLFLPAFQLNGKSFCKALEKVVSSKQLNKAANDSGSSMDDFEREIDQEIQNLEQENNVKVSSISIGNIMVKSADKYLAPTENARDSIKVIDRYYGTDLEDTLDEVKASLKSAYNAGRIIFWIIYIAVILVIVLVILVCTSMCAWYITRVNSKFTKLLYLLCVFSMVVPFQMVMFTLSLVADRTGLRTPWGIIIIYLGFGAGLAVFMFCGFVKSIPLEIEEAAMIDGCTPLRTFFSVVLPIMKPTYISVGILETMWIWNDFLLPYLVLDLNKYKTISIAIQYMKGSYGRVDMGAVMAALILAVIPVVIFYLACQKHIIKGVAAGAVKG